MSERVREPRQHATRDIYTAFDRALVKAAQNGNTVRITLADGEQIEGTVKTVDKFFVELRHQSGQQVQAGYTAVEEWFNKALLLRCWIRP
jgi:sRNA-binding regulator protein Hfq